MKSEDSKHEICDRFALKTIGIYLENSKSRSSRSRDFNVTVESSSFSNIGPKFDCFLLDITEMLLFPPGDLKRASDY
jgi:hypothetical protein